MENNSTNKQILCWVYFYGEKRVIGTGAETGQYDTPVLSSERACCEE